MPSDFASLSLTNFVVASPVTRPANDLMKEWYEGFDPLRGKVLVFTYDEFPSFVRAVYGRGLKIEGVTNYDVIWKYEPEADVVDSANRTECVVPRTEGDDNLHRPESGGGDCVKDSIAPKG